MGHLIQAEAKVFKPKAVNEEVDVPGLIVAIVVVLAFHRLHYALLLVIAQKVRGNAQNL
jgi:hypothetical protein